MKWLIDLLKKWFEKKKPKPEPVDQFPDDIDPAEIRWLGEDVGAWQKKYSLKVTLNSAQIIYDQEGTANWTPKKTGGGDNLVGNPWIIAKLNGQWTGASHEWFRQSQRMKGKASVDGNHIKKREFGGDDWKSWTPTIGEQYGFVVTGLARCSARNQRERTQIVIITWK